MPRKTNKQKIVDSFAPNTDMSLTSNFSPTKVMKVRNLVMQNKKIVGVTAGTLVMLLILGFAIKSYTDLQTARQELSSLGGQDSAQAQAEGNKIIEAVGKLVVLPENEQPTVATVTDPAKLSDQEFFLNAQAGDKVLIYAASKRAVLYRPSSNKIIEIAPLNIDDNTGQVAGDSSLEAETN